MREGRRDGGKRGDSVKRIERKGGGGRKGEERKGGKKRRER